MANDYIKQMEIDMDIDEKRRENKEFREKTIFFVLGIMIGFFIFYIVKLF